jgi:hypothetical protein
LQVGQLYVGKSEHVHTEVVTTATQRKESSVIDIIAPVVKSPVCVRFRVNIRQKVAHPHNSPADKYESNSGPHFPPQKLERARWSRIRFTA